VVLRLEAHPTVRPELLRLAGKLDQASPGEGEEFLRAVGAAIERIYENPTMWPIAQEPLRFHNVTGFDFSVYYELSEDAVYILGVN
jgi:hypothetical protein